MTNRNIHEAFATKVEAGQLAIVMIPWIPGAEVEFNNRRHYIVQPTSAPEFGFLVHDSEFAGSTSIRKGFGFVCSCCVHFEGKAWQDYKQVVANICNKQGIKQLFIRKPWAGRAFGLETHDSTWFSETIERMWKEKKNGIPFREAFAGVW